MQAKNSDAFAAKHAQGHRGLRGGRRTREILNGSSVSLVVLRVVCGGARITQNELSHSRCKLNDCINEAIANFHAEVLRCRGQGFGETQTTITRHMASRSTHFRPRCSSDEVWMTSIRPSTTPYLRGIRDRWPRRAGLVRNDHRPVTASPATTFRYGRTPRSIGRACHYCGVSRHAADRFEHGGWHRRSRSFIVAWAASASPSKIETGSCETR